MENRQEEKLRSTAEMMFSSNYKDRFCAEYWQLKIRADRLEDILRKLNAGTADFKPSCPVSLLSMQLHTMKDYLNCLEKRAGIEGIKL